MNIILWYFSVAFFSIQVRSIDDFVILIEYYELELNWIKFKRAEADIDNGIKVLDHDSNRTVLNSVTNSHYAQANLTTDLDLAYITFYEYYTNAIASQKPESVLTCLKNAIETVVSGLQNLRSKYSEDGATNVDLFAMKKDVYRANFDTAESTLAGLASLYNQQLEACLVESCLQAIYNDAQINYNNLTTYINYINNNVEDAFGQFLKTNDADLELYNQNRENALANAFDAMENC